MRDGDRCFCVHRHSHTACRGSIRRAAFGTVGILHSSQPQGARPPRSPAPRLSPAQRRCRARKRKRGGGGAMKVRALGGGGEAMAVQRERACPRQQLRLRARGGGGALCCRTAGMRIKCENAVFGCLIAFAPTWRASPISLGPNDSTTGLWCVSCPRRHVHVHRAVVWFIHRTPSGGTGARRRHRAPQAGHGGNCRSPARSRLA